MFLTRWLRGTTRTPNNARTTTRPRFRPSVEGLEGRDVPSTLTVTTALDVVDPNDGVLSLREAIQQANPATPGGDTIAFDSGLNGQTITLSGSELLLDKNINIQGPGADQLTISGNQKSRVFEVAPLVHASLAGLTIRDGYAAGSNLAAEVGGGIFNLGNLTLSGCTFSHDHADARGGAISNGGGQPGWLAVSGCTFSDNLAAGIGGGAIDNDNGRATVSDSTFSTNQSYDNGGAIYNINTFTVIGSTFSGNTSYSGGALYNDGTMTVNSSTLSDNHAYGSGGGILNYYFNNPRLTVTGCTLSGNSAAESGGGLYDEGITTLQTSTLSNNTAGISGGGSLSRQSMSMSGCTVTGNSAAREGGGIWASNGLSITGGTVGGNTASSGGGIYNRGGTFTANSATVSNNVATVSGGGVYASGFTTTLSGCTLSGNSAASGGAIYCVPWSISGSLTVSGCTITGNSADVGGGIYNADAPKASLTITGSTITGNTATTKGGGLYNAGTASVQNTKITNNSAGAQGGGIFNDSAGTLTLYSSTSVTGNSAPEGADIDNFGHLNRKKG
jgi:predicted outer membrane repeat protein